MRSRANLRLIPRLDIKFPNLIKGIQLEGVRKLGDPRAFARRYYDSGADELLYIDMVASLYQREQFDELIQHTACHLFIPLTVGGGVTSVEDAERMLKAGADKVAINTAAVRRPELIEEIATRFGSQCMVLSIQAKRQGPDKWEAYMDCGRERSGLGAVEWARRGGDLGAGEILITSVDQEGTQQGFDVELCRRVSEAVTIPVIASGGMGKVQHCLDVAEQGRVDAVAMAHVLHYDKTSLSEVRAAAMEAGLPVRKT